MRPARRASRTLRRSRRNPPSSQSTAKTRRAAVDHTAALRTSELCGLLPAEDRVLRSLRDAELHHALGRNLDLLARRRIAADPRLAIHEHELAQAGNRERVFCLAI